jgi:hypothetical protein
MGISYSKIPRSAFAGIPWAGAAEAHSQKIARAKRISLRMT